MRKKLSPVRKTFVLCAQGIYFEFYGGVNSVVAV